MKLSKALDLGMLKVEQFFPLKEGISIDNCGYFFNKDGKYCFCALGIIFCGWHSEEFPESELSLEDSNFRKSCMEITTHLFDKFPALNDNLSYQKITEVIYDGKYKHIPNLRAYELFWEARNRNFYFSVVSLDRFLIELNDVFMVNAVDIRNILQDLGY